MADPSELRQLPAVSTLLEDPRLQALIDQHTRPVVVAWVRATVAQCRAELRGQSGGTDCDWSERIIGRVLLQGTDFQGDRMQPVINATGVLLHTNLGRAPLADAATQRIGQAIRWANVELNLATGRRSHRGDPCCRMLATLVGAEAALVVNNCAAATMLALQATAAGRQVIISRGQLIEIGGGFRLPDVFASAGVELCEVGTTNRTYINDYVQAIGQVSGAVLRVHRSNFEQTGFVTEPTVQELVAAINQRLPVIDDLGSGNLYDLTPYGLSEPSVQQSVRSGADLTLFSGDKLFGGPQCGWIVGKKRWIDQLKRNPMMRAMRCDKITLAALEATVELHCQGVAFETIPVLKMIAQSSAALRQRCEQLCASLAENEQWVASQAAGRFSIAIQPSQSEIGGGSAPQAHLDSFHVAITNCPTQQLADALRHGTPAVVGYQRNDAVCLDLRTVFEDELPSLCKAVQRALAQL